MTLLRDGADAYYNGVLLFIYESKVSARPVQDSAGRTTKMVELTIDVPKALVEPFTANLTVDSHVNYLIRQLTQQGGVLHWNGKGYGKFYVNDLNFRDVKFGPVTDLVDIQPWGNGRSAFVSWKVKTWLPRCPVDDVSQYANKLMELVFGQEHKIDRNGYSSIHITGNIEIPLNRTSPPKVTVDADGVPQAYTETSRSIYDHVDAWRSRALQTPVPLGFQREDFDFAVAPAKNAAKFSWVDRQQREPLPGYATETTIRHDVKAKGATFNTYVNTLRGTIVPPPNVSKDFSYRYFLAFVADRWAFARNYTPLNDPPVVAPPPASPQAPANGGGLLGAVIAGIAGVAAGAAGGARVDMRPDQAAAKGNPGNPVAIIPHEISVSNELNGRGVEFSFSYSVIRRFYLAEAMLGQGVWRPFPYTNWFQWRESMDRAKVTDVRGPSNIFFRKEDDAIIDLCVPSNTAPPVVPGGKQGPLELPEPIRADNKVPLQNLVAKMGAGPGDVASSVPDLPASWLRYDVDLSYEEPLGRYARHRPLIGTVTDVPSAKDAAGPAKDIRDAAACSPASALWDKADIMQEVGPPTTVLRLHGTAIRIGNRIPLPRLLAASGFNVKLNRVVFFREVTIERWGDMRIWRADWEQEYYLDTPLHRAQPKLADPVRGLNGAVNDPTLQNAVTAPVQLGGNLITG